MATKQIKIDLQSQPTSTTDVILNISVDGTIVFNQTVPPAGPIQLNTSDPHESITFDLDMPESANLRATQNRTFSITASNGHAKIRDISCNFTPASIISGPNDVNTFVPGTANNYRGCDIVSQPLWNGQALIDRYNLADNPSGEPGEVYIASGETVVFDVSVFLYNSSTP